MAVRVREFIGGRFRLAAALCAVMTLVGANRPTQRGASAKRVLHVYQEKHRERHEQFVQSLEKLAQSCDTHGLSDASAQVRRTIVPFATDTLCWEPLPRKIQPAIPADLVPEQREWQVQLRLLKQRQANDLYLLSRRVLNAGFPSYAYNLVREVAQYDPDHQAARRLLGYERYKDAWVTPFTATMLRKHFVWHDRFGWLPESYVPRYERGERFFRRWMDVAKERELRQDFRNAWEIRTDHYLVKTDHSLERGVELAKALEDFYAFFQQTFVAFFNTPEQMQKLFEGGISSTHRYRRDRPYEVHFYRSQQEYVQRLQSRIPQIAITNGLYLPEDRVIYTFYNPAPETNIEGTLFHEATHQLFYQSQTRDRAIGRDGHFWIVEGIACYMESLRRGPDGVSVGDPSFIRFQNARYRYLNDGYYIPLEQFRKLGKTELQLHPDIAKIYQQASGLTHFFMHYDNGRYRDAIVEQLSQIYNVNLTTIPRVQTIEELTGVSFKDLDRQYGEFVRTLEKSGK